MGISLFLFFSIVASAIVIATLFGVYFGRKHSKHNTINPLIHNSDHPFDEVITKDFKIDDEDLY